VFLKLRIPIEYNLAMMFELQPLNPVDYLVIGHLAVDLTSNGPTLGGTAAYASLSAQALGLRVGIVTSFGNEITTSVLNHIPIISYPTLHSTNFENIQSGSSRIQYVRQIAAKIDLNLIPDPWKEASIVHLAPIAQEVEPTLARAFPNSLLGVTPQGWMRAWDSNGLVHPTDWLEATYVLPKANATVLSIEDIANDEHRIEEMAASCHILAITEAEKGSRVYWNGDVRRFPAPSMQVVEATGAGDIYAAAFFIRLFDTNDPWEAGRFATQLASFSVTRAGLASAPTAEEIKTCSIEVF
jgi:sugar/nucleoside kinase (ribokinase family)